VLLENREWSDGVVTQFHRSSGKHCVEFRANGARRWLVMLRTAFFIVDRNGGSGNSSEPAREEMKEPDFSPNRPRGEPWTFSEDLSLEFARAQSVLHACYGGRTQEVGHKTLGHVCVTEADKREADEQKGSLLYGELLPRGVHKALDAQHLDAASATGLYDLGMGTGKVIMQAFLQHENLQRCYGVELSLARFKVAEKAALELASKVQPHKFIVLSSVAGRHVVVKNTQTQQLLHLVYGNLMATPDMHTADVLLLETDIPADFWKDLSQLLDHAAEGARILSYLDLSKVWTLPGQPFPFKQLEANKSFADRYPTTWSVNRGHHLFLWVKVLKPGQRALKGADAKASAAGAHTAASKAMFKGHREPRQSPSWADEIACGHKWPTLLARPAKKGSAHGGGHHSSCAIS